MALLFIRRGSSQSAFGSACRSIILAPALIKAGTLKVDINDCARYSKIVSDYRDADKAQRSKSRLMRTLIADKGYDSKPFRETL
ncbi:MAG: hypothetical protein BGP09_13885 [Rhizobium sp. 60-20]|jgi:phage protein D|nr:MAG: hypothetical protein BGP09_13885 [Rhizobium sp. 60-20]RKD72685.1 hypothetical protein BJ928_102470 [Rhizobium sp. WW_1]